MRYVELFSGIAASSVAWHPLGWEPVAFSEIEPFPCSVLAHRFPHVPNLGDVTKITEADIMMLGQVDLVVFGSPCQDLSVAGKRKGLDGARSGLFFDAMRIVGWLRQWCGLRFALWENVPGAFTSNEGADFAAVVDALAGVADGGADLVVPPKGWGNEGCAIGTEAMVEWGTLDAQWAGVPQRRRRVFALADFGDWTGRPPILLEPQGMRGDSPPRRGAREDVAGTLASRTEGGGFPGSDEAMSGYVQPVAGALAASTGGSDENDAKDGRLVVERGSVLTCASNGEGAEGPPFLTVSNLSKTVNNQTPLLAFSCKDYAADAPEECSPTLRAMNHSGSHANAGGQVAVAYMPSRTWDPETRTNEERFAAREVCDALHTGTGAGNKAPLVVGATCVTGKITHALNTCNGGKGSSEDGTWRGTPIIAFQSSQSGVRVGMRVRRLTPLECERLQDFPDNWTQVPNRGKPAADGPRYKALGNSMAVCVMRWIGQQIDFAWRMF